MSLITGLIFLIFGVGPMGSSRANCGGVLGVALASWLVWRFRRRGRGYGVGSSGVASGLRH